jgi:hypothetical protein
VHTTPTVQIYLIRPYTPPVPVPYQQCQWCKTKTTFNPFPYPQFLTNMGLPENRNTPQYNPYRNIPQYNPYRKTPQYTATNPTLLYIPHRKVPQHNAIYLNISQHTATYRINILFVSNDVCTSPGSLGFRPG